MIKDLPLDEVYRLIEPGPVVLLATRHEGRANVMTMSWHMMMDFVPPTIGCVVSSANHSFKALSATGECVIAIPDVDLACSAVRIGNCSGRDTDKFEKLGLVQAPAACVQAPLLPQCFANLECKVVDTAMVQRHNLFVLEVVQAWIDKRRRKPRTIHHHGYGTFVVDGDTIRLKSRMP